MMTCKQITELATDYAEGYLRFFDRLRFRRHLAVCAGCRAFVGQMEMTARELGKLPDPEVPPELMEALLRSFDGRRRASAAATVERGAQPRTFASVLAVLAAPVVAVALSSHHSRSAVDWAVGSALAASAVALAAFSSRFSLGVVLVGVSAALAAALPTGGDGPLGFPAGLHCLGIEVASAAAVVGIVWLAFRRGLTSRVRYGLAATAVAGAVAGDAALEIICDVHAALPHVLAFHVGGVAVVAAGALLAVRWWPQPAHS